MISKAKSIIFSIFISSVLLGCQTRGYLIEESDRSVRQHRQAITASLGQVRTVSENGRELYSYYHDRKLNGLEVGPKTKERLYTKVSILGTRRPYAIAVEVVVEKRDPVSKEFIEIGLDEGLAEKRGLQIQDLLNQSLDKTGQFDDQAPF